MVVELYFWVGEINGYRFSYSSCMFCIFYYFLVWGETAANMRCEDGVENIFEGVEMVYGSRVDG